MDDSAGLPRQAYASSASSAPGHRPTWTVLRALVRTCHPEPTAAVTAVAVALAVATGRDPLGTVTVAAAVLAGQLSVGWQNDYLDRQRDRQAHRLDKPVAQGTLRPHWVRLAAAGSGVATIPLSLLSGLLPGLLHLVAVASAWSYNLRLKATVVSVVPYAVSFGLLPAFVVTGLPGHPVPPAWLVLAGALLGAGAHFVNVLPDLADDARTGVRGLPHRLGPTASRGLAAVLLVGASAALAFGPPGGLGGRPGLLGGAAVGAALLVAAGGMWWGRAPGSRVSFLAVLVLAVVDVMLLLVAGRGIA